jgi:hypothetical protein
MYYYNCRCELSDLLGKTLSAVSATEDEVTFKTVDGDVYKLLHIQDCCESVYIESIVGDLQDLVGEPILRADEEQDLFDVIKQAEKESKDESYTWTFYKLATRKGYVDIRWYGSSNGYYSESVDFIKVTDED